MARSGLQVLPGGVIADVLEDSVVENCVSDHVALIRDREKKYLPEELPGGLRSP